MKNEKYGCLFIRFPNTACELLTSDVPQISEKLAGDDALMAKVYGFLESDATLNPLLASFFSKVMGLLISRKSEMVSLLSSYKQIVMIYAYFKKYVIKLKLVLWQSTYWNINQCYSWANHGMGCFPFKKIK